MQEQSTWIIGFATLGSFLTAIYAVFFVFKFFLYRKGKNKTTDTLLTENGKRKSVSSRLSTFIFNALTALFATIGAIVTAVFAFLSLAALSIHTIAPHWNPVERLQKRVASSFIAVIAPSSGAEPFTQPVLNPPDTVFKTDRFTVLLYPATHDESIHVRATITNISSKRLFLALNNSSKSFIIDDKSNITSTLITHYGIKESSANRGGLEFEESSYTQILPGQSLDVGLMFSSYRPKPQGNGNIHVGFEFISFSDGQIKNIPVSIGTSLR